MSLVPAGQPHLISIKVTVNGLSTNGAAVVAAKIQRASDGTWDDGFGVWGASPGYYTMPVNAGDDSVYEYLWTTPTSPAAGDVYLITRVVTSPYNGSDVEEVDTRALAHVEAATLSDTQAVTATLTSTINALSVSILAAVAGVASTLANGVTVAAIATDAITGTSIASSAVTKLQSGLATAASLATAAADALAARQRLTNRRKIAADGTETLYADDGTTPLKTRVYTDVTGGPISLSTGEPARASIES